MLSAREGHVDAIAAAASRVEGNFVARSATGPRRSGAKIFEKAAWRPRRKGWYPELAQVEPAQLWKPQFLRGAADSDNDTTLRGY